MQLPPLFLFEFLYPVKDFTIIIRGIEKRFNDSDLSYFQRE